MKKKILFVITKSNFGGAQKYVYDLATNLPESDFEIAVATGGTGTLIQKLSEKNIRVLPLSSLTRDVSASSDLSAFFELLNIFRNEKPDVVHLNSAKAGGVGALAARMARVPKIIFTAHGWAFNEDRPLIQKTLIKLFSWITVLLAHKTIAVSEAVARDMKYPFASRKISVIKNSVGAIDFLSRQEARKYLSKISKINIPDESFVFGTIAELHPSKGLEYSIESLVPIIEKNPYVYYFILGEGQDREKLTSLITKYHLEKRVELLGFVDNAPQYLRALDCFILPSITEGIGYVLLEAGLANLPVVATNVGGIPEVIENTVTGLLVPPRDPEAITEALDTILISPALRTDMSSALYKKVVHDFVLENMVSTTAELYH